MQSHRLSFSIKRLDILITPSQVFILIGVLLQTGIYLFLPVFAPYGVFCSAPYLPGIHAIPCDYLPRLSPQTTLQMLIFDKFWVLPLLFIIVVMLNFAAGVTQKFKLGTIAILIFFLWSGYSAYLIAHNVPAPPMQDLHWHMFLLLISVGFLLQCIGLIGDLIHAR